LPSRHVAVLGTLQKKSNQQQLHIFEDVLPNKISGPYIKYRYCRLHLGGSQSHRVGIIRSRKLNIAIMELAAGGMMFIPNSIQIREVVQELLGRGGGGGGPMNLLMLKPNITQKIKGE
jgi:hypothetical protein